ncbi:hypothetical protein AMS68_007503 [Peltaster fructicola]|uniref:SSD domain-containing protein n=1 Tax=Peltaster fructicola TaxID=286661 RepID=A0A6H0Y4U8_9PEZI|nr:hypothetical protein AMS68_007503 [Peltaster fructicola]
MRWASRSQALALFISISSIVTPTIAFASNTTAKHEAGRCAIRKQCGHAGFFGRDLPCVDNGLAETPSDTTREKLVKLCGSSWEQGDVCCTEEQVDVLGENLNKAHAIISACPACQKNFYDLFCTFTCSPDQSLFVNVTATEPAKEEDTYRVTELTQYFDKTYAQGFYDSCKDVKFGSTGGKAMDFIGGGAKNYTQLLKFLGDKKLLGSPFQINFKSSEDEDSTKPGMTEPQDCGSGEYKCACVDCPASCPALPAVQETQECHVGLLPCLSFASIIVYAGFVALLALAVIGHIAAIKHQKSKNERLQLLQDAAPYDREDEGDVVNIGGGMDRPTRQYIVNTYCDRAFSKLARLCATYPAITIFSSIIVVGILSLGWLRFEVETDPVKLWVSPDSAAAQEKQFFDNNFGPFFRAEQAFLVNDSTIGQAGPVLDDETLAWWYTVEERVGKVQSTRGYTFKDVCYKPTGDACVVQSITGYLGSFDKGSWRDTLVDCTAQPVNCRPDFGQPIQPELVLGGYNRSSDSVLDAQAIVTTWVVKGYNPNDAGFHKAEEWEDALNGLFLEVQDEASKRNLRLSFNTEISLEQELNKTTNTDAKIVIISYIVMFIYASLALGSTTITFSSIIRNPTAALVQSKFLLGIVGILIVLMSVSASVGLFAAAGVKATLIIAEVIPFLVLAVGVDNIFLIVHEFERVNVSHADEAVVDRIARALGRMGPSILLSATTETVAIALGAAVGMPAVRNFAAYAAGAVLINALLQWTMFVAILALNQERVEDGRADCVPCIKLKGASDYNHPNGFGGAPFSGADEEGWLSRFIRKQYAPAILENKARVAIITIFLGFFAAGVALLPELQLGLDQRIAIPNDSYLIPYFNDLYDYFGAGPPVYFVTRDLNVTAREGQQELCARFGSCQASCCVDGKEACFEGRDPEWNATLYGMPEGEEFTYYLQRWLKAYPGEECLAGKAAYGDAVRYNLNRTTTPATHFRTAHTPLRSQEDFINAYASARRIANDISERNNIDVFPYSKFYIFFEQYATIRGLSVGLVGAALAIILVITSILLGSVATGLVVTITVAMIVIDVVGTMALAGVSLNAVSLVNIVICVGIGVEFCAHVARAFTVPSPSILERAHLHVGSNARVARAWAALVNVGGSVFSGITITKLLGVFVLAFTHSKIFEIYYFRVWLALVVWAALHALIFLPVALSFFGGRGFVDPESDGGLEQDLAGRRYRALLPEDDYDSDEY